MVRKPNSRDAFVFATIRIPYQGWDDHPQKKKLSPWHIRESWQNTWWIMASKKGHAAVGNSFNQQIFFLWRSYRQKIVRGFQDYNDCSFKGYFFFFWGGGTEVAGAFHTKNLWWFQTFDNMFTPLGKILILTTVFQMCWSHQPEQIGLEWNGMVLWTHLGEFVGANDFFWSFSDGFLGDPISWNEPQKEPSDFPLLYIYWSFHRDPYDGLVGLL